MSVNDHMETRTQILVRGTVQGVGFRPYVFSLATGNSLKGQVYNNATGVLIDVEGEAHSIKEFIAELKLKPPPLSIVDAIESKTLQTLANYEDFRIVESNGNGTKFVPVSADVATCPDCLREMFDPQNRRYRYPFINCTNCGPRFTIIEGVPYDRENTTMRDFEMCGACRAEYDDPRNRRFHAEPTCCPNCGPQVLLRSTDIVNTTGWECAVDPIESARRQLRIGKILAVKSLGGFHLVCDALNAKAVETLRQRKYREDKPFALMADSLETIRRYCLVSEAEKRSLQANDRPIVLLERIKTLPNGRVSALPQAIAPGVNTLGFMLPYTPLHYLLLEGLKGPLVMTSGNISNEPICYRDAEASERFKKIAEHYLTHDRRIHIRTDDSVSRVRTDGKSIVLRRSRGYAPTPIKTPFKFARQVLACGAELKSTFCLAKDNYAFISHHIGDLENLETLRSFTEGVEYYKRLFDLSPDVIAYDLHPEYLSTKFAHSSVDIETKIGIQHHHAHIVSCMADNGTDGEVIGVAMDGLGVGTDGKLWGGEFFVADLCGAERVAHLDYIPLPGGTTAIREPWRLAAVYLEKAFGGDFLDLDIPFANELDRRKWAAISSMIVSGTNCPETSSMGRLFDAISALLGVRHTVNYEGQAAIELEAVVDKTASGSYHFELADRGIIKAEQVIKHAVGDLLNGASAAEVSAKFHMSVANLIANLSLQTRDQHGLNRVALSGGVFQNMFLLERTCRLLNALGFEVLTHSRVPTNDGGISFGQAVIANTRIQRGSY